jgi:hypothetical protein
MVSRLDYQLDGLGERDFWASMKRAGRRAGVVVVVRGCAPFRAIRARHTLQFGRETNRNGRRMRSFGVKQAAVDEFVGRGACFVSEMS